MSDNLIGFPSRRLSQDEHAACLRVGATVTLTDCGNEHVDLPGAHVCRDGLAWVVVGIDGRKRAAFRSFTEALAEAQSLALKTALDAMVPS